ncbi:MAG: excinuclease ABC subunit C, partial [Rhizobiales bacterium]|nr:excinuclease ABC subunit C [Hyphomicrobiales bacterium]
MVTDSFDPPKPRKPPPGTIPDDAPAASGLDPAMQDIDPASAGGNGEDEEEQLPEAIDEGSETVAEGPFAVGRAV